MGFFLFLLFSEGGMKGVIFMSYYPMDFFFFFPLMLYFDKRYYFYVMLSLDTL